MQKSSDIIFSKDDKRPLMIGDRVENGQFIGTVHSMNLVFEVKSPLSGEVCDVLVKNEQNVEYGKVLFKIKKKGD